MILNDYRQILAKIRQVFETSFEWRTDVPANAAPTIPAVQPKRRSSPGRDGTNPWGIESRRNY